MKRIHLKYIAAYLISLALALLLIGPTTQVLSLAAAAPILYYIFEVTRITNDHKVKIAQAFVYLTVAVTLIFYWNWQLFIIGVFLGWMLFGIGVSMCLHKWASHKTFEPKNNFWKLIISWFGTICTLGSTIGWAAGHRQHHRYTDKQGDPHRPAGSFWHKIKIYFYYFPTYHISPMIVKDLTVEPFHKFFHKNYFKVIYSYAMLLYVINPVYLGYFYALPALYVFVGISWVTVTAHIPSSGKYGIRRDIYRIYNSDDYTYNSHVWQFLTMGEGYHNTHHACPGLWNNALLPGEFDISAQLIKIMGIPKNRRAKPFASVRRYPEVFDEIQAVAAKNKISDKPERVRST